MFAALAGIIAGMDSVTWRLLVGGSLMLTGVFIVELLPSCKGVVAEIEAEEGPAGADGSSGARERLSAGGYEPLTLARGSASSSRSS